MSSTFHFIDTELHPGLSVIEASAGTGKTYAISRLVPRLLVDGIVGHVGEILLVTFTNDAARELSGRVRQVLEQLAGPAAGDEAETDLDMHRLRQKMIDSGRESTLRQALIDIDKLAVSTIHSFCKRTIDMEGTLCGVPAPMELITDAAEVIEEAVREAWEEQIAHDDMLSMLAAMNGWNLKEDIYFAKKAVGAENCSTEPVTESYRNKLGRLENISGDLTGPMYEQLCSLISRVPDKNWNKGGADPEIRKQHLSWLDPKNRPCFSREIKSALEWVSLLPGHIANRGEGKPLRIEAEALVAVLVAAQILELPSLLRWDWQNACVDAIREKVRTTLRANRQITQDGLIVTLREALRSQETGRALANRLRERYQVALIDESQDTDAKQFEIFKNIFCGFDGEHGGAWKHRLILIGDPKQAIYGFRGADVNTYLAAKKMAETASAAPSIHTLLKTFRAPQPLVDAVNALFSPADSFHKSELQFRPASSGKNEDVQLCRDGVPVEGRIEAWIVPDSENRAYQTKPNRVQTITDTVASEIVRLLAAGEIQSGPGEKRGLEPRDFAVLTNSNAQAESMAAALKNRGVPAVVKTGADVLESDEASELLAVLQAVHSPRRFNSRYAAFATRLLGFNDQKIRALRADGNGGEDEMIIGKLIDWHVIWEQKGIASALALIDAEYKIIERLAAAEFGERRVTNFRQLIDLVQAVEHDDSMRPEHLLRWLSQEIQRTQTSEAPEERQIQLESDAAAVQVLTMHKSKGLEYNLVFCPFLWETYPVRGVQILTSEETRHQAKLIDTGLTGNEEIRTALERSQMEERLRLVYVALTRAKVSAWFYAGQIGADKGEYVIGASPLDWLLRDKTQPINTHEEFRNWAAAAKSPGRGGRHSTGIVNLQPEGIIHQTAPPAVTSDPWKEAMKSEAPKLEVLAAPKLPGYWRVTSFSALTRETHRHGGGDFGGGDIIPDVQGGDAIPGVLDIRNDVPTTVVPTLNAFAAAPGSPLIGSAIHEWLEQWDFGGPEKTAPTAEQLTAHLKKYPLLKQRVASDPEDQKGIEVAGLVEMLTHLAGAVLPGLGCTISEGCPSPKASEWNFHMKINQQISAEKLSSAFEKSPDPQFPDYAEDLAELTTSSIRGYLQGFMDRLVFHNDSYGVIDWKSNKLGITAGAYTEKSMIRCAVENHYILQTHLYLVALRRFLILSGKEAAQMAGAWLVFLRAVQAGSTGSILHIHPSEELLDELDQLFFQPNP